MREQVAEVEPVGRETVDYSAARQAGSTPSDSPDRPGGKFLYPGGSRPLQGYTIKRGVGHGGFGEIYYAMSDAGKEVALKLVRRNLDVELRGIRHCLNLKHPNLLGLFDIRQDEQGDTWVVMEYVSGGSLEDALAPHDNGLPTEEALAWFHGIANGIGYLHDRGIVHRDLKPGNVFDDEGVVKVGDYGLAKFMSCSRRSGQTESVGTVHYMAPEVANGRYGKEIDIYALGIMLYEMLTGRVPFDGESVGEVLMKHLTAQPDLTGVPEPYRNAIARALEKDPARRFSSVAEMQAALPQPAAPQPGVGRLPSAAAAAGAAAGTAGASPFAGEPVAVEVVREEEPVLAAVRDTWHKLSTAWSQADVVAPVKIVLLVIIVLLMIASAQVVIPLTIVLLIVYGVYRLVRAIVMPASTRHVRHYRAQAHPDATAQTVSSAPPPGTSPAAPGAEPATAETQPRYGPGYRRHRPAYHPRQEQNERIGAVLAARPLKDKLTELCGSLLAGALVSAAMCVVVLLLAAYNSQTLEAQQVVWLVVVSIAGTWTVMVPAKFWEGTRGETALRRFTMLVLGLGLGLLACGAATLLIVSLPYAAGFPQSTDYQLPQSFYAPDGRPLAMAHLACFGTLMVLLRWWRQADPLRSSRLSLWSMFFTVVMAGIVAGLWKFPQPWLPMIAGAMSVSVQLSSPWIPQRERARYRHRD